jgi:biopolymer transport protein ExbD
MPLSKARLRISDYKANRSNKNEEKNKKVMAVSLSLTSMVDMFAILVIFLLVNNSSVPEWVDLGHDIKLPKARTSDEAKRATTISISATQVFADEKPVVDVSQINHGAIIVPALQKWLQGIKDKNGRINVVGDEKVPYSAVRRVIATAQAAGFNNVNLAVFPK